MAKNRRTDNLMTPKAYEDLNRDTLNNLTYLDYLNRLTRICISMFEWENLPKSMNPNYLEKTLFEFGTSAIFYLDDLPTNSRCTLSGVNLYWEATHLNCNIPNTFNKRKEIFTERIKVLNEKTGELEDRDVKNEAILVYANEMYCATLDTIKLFAYRLSECDRTADVNLNHQKSPFVYYTDDFSKLSMRNLEDSRTKNSISVLVDKKGMEKNSIERPFDTRAPFIVPEIFEVKQKIWNECLTFLGINNIVADKKERLLENEVENNNELLNFNLQSFLIPRQKACEQMNEFFELKGDKKVSIKLRSDLENIIKREIGLSNIKTEEIENNKGSEVDG